MDRTLSNGEPSCTRINMRMAGSGKFIHCNRFQRRNVLLSLSGKMWWLSLDSEGNVADQHLWSTSNDNWIGYRSKSLPTALTRPGLLVMKGMGNGRLLLRAQELFLVKKKKKCLSSPYRRKLKGDEMQGRCSVARPQAD